VRRIPGERVAAEIGQQQAGEAAHHREEQTFDQHLPHDACAPGAEREPDADLLLASRAASEHQRGDVGARQQQDESEKDRQYGDRGAESLPLSKEAAAAIAQTEPRNDVPGVDRHNGAHVVRNMVV
jgi:hypothetical protein